MSGGQEEGREIQGLVTEEHKPLVHPQVCAQSYRAPAGNLLKPLPAGRIDNSSWAPLKQDQELS